MKVSTHLPSAIEKHKALRIALATVFPLIVAVFALSGTMFLGEKYGWEKVPLVLVGWCVVLIGQASWLNKVLFGVARTLFPFLSAIFVILSTWLWQRLAFKVLIPSGRLTYGFFLSPEGAHAHFWVLTCPFYVGLSCLALCSVAAVLLGWRSGARFLLACMIPWWLGALLIFSLPSMDLDAQGNASIFI